ncbi:MAG: phosphate/phosphite/phosphonate ABC transporter substrate-binding protein [Chloroflexi bacterium]|nr:MAG: phosphate/phosphite/phosphonate ABC transporter substrate-binding protein [Chloroflexota bacterium]
MKMKKWSVLLIVALLATMVLTGCPKKEAALGTEENPIILSFVPSGDTPDIIESAEEIANLLSEKTGYVIKGNVATSYSAVIEAMCTGKAHMGTLATFAYILANEKCGVDCALVSVRYGSPYYRGQIIAGADTGITKLEDLKGKTMCWVDAASTSGYIIPRVMLKAAGVDPDTDLAQQTEVGSHDGVALAVYKGDCDAGATYIDVRDRVENEYPDIKEKTVVIAESPEIPNDGLQFIKDFPPDMREKIVKAFLEIMETDEGVEAMGKAYGWAGVVEKDDSFYDPFRAVLDASGIDVEELAK